MIRRLAVLALFALLALVGAGCSGSAANSVADAACAFLGSVVNGLAGAPLVSADRCTSSPTATGQAVGSDRGATCTACVEPSCEMQATACLGDPACASSKAGPLYDAVVACVRAECGTECGVAR